MDIQGWVSAVATIGFGLYQSFYARRSVVLTEKIMRGEKLESEAKKVEWWIKRHRNSFVALGVMVVCWIPYFATPRCPKEFIQSWGGLGDRLFVIVDTTDLMKDKPKRLMLIARAANHAIDEKTDTNIMRSATFEITSNPMRLDVFITPEFNLDASKVGLIQEYLLEVQEDFPVEAVHSLGEAEKRGAKILGSRSGGSSITVTPAH
jgi:hypothetical protein